MHTAVLKQELIAYEKPFCMHMTNRQKYNDKKIELETSLKFTMSIRDHL